LANWLARIEFYSRRTIPHWCKKMVPAFETLRLNALGPFVNCGIAAFRQFLNL